MQFNNYFWNLYKQSDQGKNVIDLFEKKDHQGIALKFQTGTFCNDLTDDEVNYYNESPLKNFLTAERTIDFTLALQALFSSYDFAEPRSTFETIIDGNIYFPLIDQHVEKRSYSLWINNVENFSTALFLVENEFFIPYYFRIKFDLLQSIFSYFDIPLPKIPIKKDWRGRLLYYVDLCEVLYEFRKQHALSRAELCAFLYDFAPKGVEKLTSDEMPSPSKAWFCGGNKNDFQFLDHPDIHRQSHWQGNPDTRKGDIIVMYCLAPRSYIHSIWRADRDGFIDPFFYYYTVIFISNPSVIKPVGHKELKSNAIFSKSPLVRSNMQGLIGYPIAYEEYNELLRISEKKDQNISELPAIKPDFTIDDTELITEKDVEEKLIEPLLKKLGYDEQDWLRQMPVKMGRGERNYPDYCFEAYPVRGEETAKMIIEAKFSVRNQNELTEAYYQAKSYAFRLQSQKFVVAAKEGIWIFEKSRNLFLRDVHSFYSWYQMEHPDTLHEVHKKIGKK